MRRVMVPHEMLCSRQLTASAKLLWVFLRADQGKTDRGRTELGITDHSRSDQGNRDRDTRDIQRRSPSNIAALIGVAKSTVYRAIAGLADGGWCSPDGTLAMNGGRELTSIPMALVTDATLRPQARVLYGVLQKSFNHGKKQGRCTYARVRAITGLHVRTVKRALMELAGAGWLQMSQENQLAPIRFTLCNPFLDRQRAAVAAAKRRIKRAPFRGEALMREYLTHLVDSEDFEDDASPGFLVNPASGERMQLDRYYPPKVAFEFNGPQHYGPTEKYSAEEAQKQRARDLMKIGTCVLKEIKLVIVHPEDLTADRIREKVGAALPLRPLSDKDPLIQYLESLSRTYRRQARRIETRIESLYSHRYSGTLEPIGDE